MAHHPGGPYVIPSRVPLRVETPSEDCMRLPPALLGPVSPLALLGLLLLAAPSAATAQLPPWPRQIPTKSGYTITIYQAQSERLSNNVLTGRGAISLKGPSSAEPIFGAAFYSAKVEADKDARMARLSDIKVTRVNWPGATDEQQQAFTKVVETYFSQNKLSISMDELSASLATAEKEEQSLEQLKNDPPKIVVTNELSVLLIYDGEPQLKKIENSDYSRVLNTAFAVVQNQKSGDFYLTSGKLWYTAKDAKGPWSATKNPPADLVKLVPKDTSSAPAPSKPPAIVVATEPTEVISFDGDPKWKTLPDGALLYAENTETIVIQDPAESKYYILVSGRWYTSPSLNQGPWAFVRGDQLPAAFQKIPPGSDIGDVRASIAGTEEAQDALLDAAIPQTAAINKKTAKLDLKYDGEPKFQDVPGTSVAYAVNTGTQVLRVDNHYYAVDNGVWFEAGSATGPWTVADSIPDQKIKEIPPSSPVYNTTNVHVYESTPEVVYVGYTPGYMGAYPYYGTVVYGTGYYYPPYISPYYYYPRPATWGFHVAYNPWTGWGFGMSWSVGFMSFGVMWGGGYHGCCGGYYGGGRPIVIHNTNINVNNVNIGNRVNVGNTVNRGNVPNRGGNNVYQRPEAKNRVASNDLSRRNLSQTKTGQQMQSRTQNNMYAGRDGNVYEYKGQGNFQERTNNLPGTGASAGSRDVQRPSNLDAGRQQSLNQDRMARERGAQRQQMSRPTLQRSAPRGGGRRR